MQKIKEAIVELLRRELEYAEGDGSYSQWVLGVSIKKDRSPDRIIGAPSYRARVVVKTSESPYVDGMEVGFTVPEDQVIIEANYYENTPEFQGGSVDSGLTWLKGLGDLYYQQQSNPYAKEGEADE